MSYKYNIQPIACYVTWPHHLRHNSYRVLTRHLTSVSFLQILIPNMAEKEICLWHPMCPSSGKSHWVKIKHWCHTEVPDPGNMHILYRWSYGQYSLPRDIQTYRLAYTKQYTPNHVVQIAHFLSATLTYIQYDYSIIKTTLLWPHIHILIFNNFSSHLMMA